MFPEKEQAGKFVEKVEGRIQQARAPGVRRDEEVLGQAVAEEMAEHGEYPEVLKQPWMHTHEEHQEAQKLVDLTFREDLSLALRKAQGSEHYPRNIDLLHDVLTGQLYELLTEKGVNKQGIPRWVAGVAGAGIFILAVLMAWLIIR